MITSQVLANALVLLQDGEGWSRRSFASNIDGATVPVYDEEAVAWCIRGAICRATATTQIGDDFYLASLALREQIGQPCGTWNDDPTRTFSQVRETFCRAISSAEFKESRLNIRPEWP